MWQFEICLEDLCLRRRWRSRVKLRRRSYNCFKQSEPPNPPIHTVQTATRSTISRSAIFIFPNHHFTMTVITKPSITAEALFDQISETYEDAYGGNDGLSTVFARLNDYHEAGSSVLDIGCGPGGPASRLIKAGFQVTGIDISQKMVDFCLKSFPGTFHKADMTTYEPSQQFDAIVSLFNLFQESYTTTYSMVFKMASWLRPGGTLILGTIAAENYIQDEAALCTARKHQYIENYDAKFMGRVIPATFLTMSRWLNVVQQAGLFIQVVDLCDFEIKGFKHKESHLFITARKMNLEPLFGPYPLPTFRRRPHLLSEGAWKPFAERLTRHEFDAVLKAVELNKEVLDIGSGHGGESIDTSTSLRM